MDFFSSWVRWHGPVRSVSEWIAAADEFGRDGKTPNERVRLYMALGRAKRVSIRGSQILYVGLNSRDADQSLGQEIASKTDKMFRGLFNEYWLGEILTQWADEDTNNGGLTKNTERALIYALDPMQNLHGYLSPPEFSFRVVNILKLPTKHGRWIKTRFESLIPSYVELDLERRIQIVGRFRIDVKAQAEIDTLRRLPQHSKRKSYEDCWRQRFQTEESAPNLPITNFMAAVALAATVIWWL